MENFTSLIQSKEEKAIATVKYNNNVVVLARFAEASVPLSFEKRFPEGYQFHILFPYSFLHSPFIRSLFPDLFSSLKFTKDLQINVFVSFFKIQFYYINTSLLSQF